MLIKKLRVLSGHNILATRNTKDNEYVSPIRPFLDTPGDPPVIWNQWIKQFRVYLIASGFHKETDDVQPAFLCHSLDGEDQRFFSSIPGFDKSTLSLSEAIDLLTKHFEPRQSVIAQWVKFITLEQKPGQSVNDFVVALA